MCRCPEVKIEDVSYRAKGHRMLPYHKECGDWLSKSQAEVVEDGWVKRWEIE